MDRSVLLESLKMLCRTTYWESVTEFDTKLKAERKEEGNVLANIRQSERDGNHNDVKLYKHHLDVVRGSIKVYTIAFTDLEQHFANVEFGIQEHAMGLHGELLPNDCRLLVAQDPQQAAERYRRVRAKLLASESNGARTVAKKSTPPRQPGQPKNEDARKVIAARSDKKYSGKKTSEILDEILPRLPKKKRRLCLLAVGRHDKANKEFYLVAHS